MLKITTNDGLTMDVEKTVATKFTTISDMIDCCGDIDDCVKLENVSQEVLQKLLNIVQLLKSSELLEDGADRALEMLSSCDLDELKLLVEGVDFLGNEELLDLVCKAIAKKIAGKSLKELKEFFGFESEPDPTPEEMEQILNEYGFLIT